MIIHPDWVNVVREIFAGVRSLGVAGHAGSFVAGMAFLVFLLWGRKKLRIG